MKIISIEHVGIAIESLKEDNPFWQLLFKDTDFSTEKISDQKVNTAIYNTGKGKVELLEATSSKSPISKFIKKRGKGMHHICFQVEDIQAAIRELLAADVIMIDVKPKIGAEGLLVAFIHPKSTGGVLVELAQKP